MTEDDPELMALREKRAQMLRKEINESTERMSWPGSPIEINDHNFKDVVARYPLLVIDFWAPWCGPCKMMSPLMDMMAKNYQGRIVFGKMNVDENPKMANIFKVMSIPTLMIVKDREMVERITGAVPRNTLEQYLEKYSNSQ